MLELGARCRRPVSPERRFAKELGGPQKHRHECQRCGSGAGVTAAAMHVWAQRMAPPHIALCDTRAGHQACCRPCTASHALTAHSRCMGTDGAMHSAQRFAHFACSRDAPSPASPAQRPPHSTAAAPAPPLPRAPPPRPRPCPRPDHPQPPPQRRLPTTGCCLAPPRALWRRPAPRSAPPLPGPALREPREARGRRAAPAASTAPPRGRCSTARALPGAAAPLRPAHNLRGLVALSAGGRRSNPAAPAGRHIQRRAQGLQKGRQPALVRVLTAPSTCQPRCEATQSVDLRLCGLLHALNPPNGWLTQGACVLPNSTRCTQHVLQGGTRSRANSLPVVQGVRQRADPLADAQRAHAE